MADVASTIPARPMIKNNLRKKKIIVFLTVFVFSIALGAAGFVAYKQYFIKEPSSSIIPKKSPKLDVAASTLDGTEVAKDLANRHPLAVIIENHPEARPQIGLDKASIVYEAITEGGITRFMAIYGPRDAEKVGPVRSMRTFFLDWASEYNAFLAHVGGNIDALDRIPAEGQLDLDQFALGEAAYWREPERGKAIEHTMYSNTPKLYQAAQAKNWDMKGNFTSFKFLDPKKFVVEQGGVQKITINFSSASYKVTYDYNPINNNYERSMDDAVHRDRDTGNPLTPRNVIIQSVPRHEGTTRMNENSWTFDTIGEGKAIVLYGGKRIDATWKKQDLRSRTKFYDTSGKEIQFLPGQFWYEIVPPDIFDRVKIEVSASQG